MSDFKVAIYIRLGREDTEEDKPQIKAQKEMLQQFAIQQGFIDTTCFVDNGHSGLNFDRPAFSEMEAAIQAGNIHAVMARDISRIGRNLFDVLSWVDGLNERNVKLITPDGQIGHPIYARGQRDVKDTQHGDILQVERERRYQHPKGKLHRR